MWTEFGRTQWKNAQLHHIYLHEKPTVLESPNFPIADFMTFKMYLLLFISIIQFICLENSAGFASNKYLGQLNNVCTTIKTNIMY